MTIFAKRGAAFLTACLTTMSLTTMSLTGCGSQATTYTPPPPPKVTTAQPVRKSILEYFDENGVTEPAEEAEVRARVRGFIEEIKFEPGQRVEAEQELYLIEQDTYKAEVQSAQAAITAAEAAIAVALAEVDNAKADLVNAEANYSREQRLFEQNAGSEADRDRALAAKESAAAAVKSAEAKVEASRAEEGRLQAELTQKELDLAYTVVKAPIAGRITKTFVKKGNLVDNGDQLATIINRDRIFANFNISDRQMLQFQKEQRVKLEAGEELVQPDWSEVKVFLRRETDQGFPFTGRLDYIDQAGIDADTGTLGLRAVFDNEDDQLLGGLFVNVRVPAEEKVDALLIPELALARDQQGLYVLTVNDQNKVEQARVSVSSRISGWAMIEGGVDESTRVIVDGLQRAFPGSEVSVEETILDVDEDELLRGMTPAEDTIAGKPDQSSGESPDANPAANNNPGASSTHVK